MKGKEKVSFLFSFYREQRSRNSEGKNAEKLQRQINGQVRKNRWKLFSLVVRFVFLVFFLLLFENASARLFFWSLFCSASVPHKSIKWYEIANLVLLLCSALFFTRRALWARTKLLINVFFILRWIFMKTMSFIHMRVCQREMAFNCNLNLSWADLNT